MGKVRWKALGALKEALNNNHYVSTEEAEYVLDKIVETVIEEIAIRSSRNRGIVGDHHDRP